MTSDPEQPLVKGAILQGEKTQDVLYIVRNLEPSDKTANLSRALLEVQEDHLKASSEGAINRTVYVISDLRARDWQVESSEESDDPGPAEILNEIAKMAEGGAQIVDVGAKGADNLYIEEMKLVDEAGEPTWLVAGIESIVEVTVRNASESGVSDFDVGLVVTPPSGNKEVITLTEKVEDDIPPGESAVVKFNINIPGEVDVTKPIQNVQMTAVVQRPDALPKDNLRAMAGRMIPGLRALLVDGEPSADRQFAETYFLEKTLAPTNKLSGILVDVKSDNEFEGFEDVDDLAPYHIIFLCNVYQLNENHQRMLDEWVRDGGGLVFALGGQIDMDHYNEKLFAGGKGLLPVEIVERREVDAGKTEFTRFHVGSSRHPISKQFAVESSQAAIGLPFVAVKQWWHTVIPEAIRGEVRVPFLFSDEDKSPAMVERSHGSGRVMAMMTPVDHDWTNMPDI